MIPKAQILSLATEQDLLPTTIEKDYALGWILFGIAHHPVASKWVFKGGTCLKKCFFNTYRFSEDLDFTIPVGQPYEHAAILSTLRDVTRWVDSEAGLAFLDDGLDFEEYGNLRGNKSFQGKASFVGPLQMGRRSLQRIKFDLTQDEVLVDKPTHRDVQHAYADNILPAPQALCYSINEINAEKSRALYERQGRARDVYDVVHISRAFRESVDPAIASHVLRRKFDFKRLPPPSVEVILGRIDEGVLRANWTQQLRHQLPVLPDVDGFTDSLPEAIGWWLEPTLAAGPLAPISDASNETSAPREPFPYSPIIYAAHNHLCLHIHYKDVDRLVEPYSLRHPKTGNTLLYVWERQRGGVQTEQIKAFEITEIQDVQVTSIPFGPRFHVEL